MNNENEGVAFGDTAEQQIDNGTTFDASPAPPVEMSAETLLSPPAANNEENTTQVNDSAATTKNDEGIDPANDEAALQEQINKQRQEALANDLEAKLQNKLAGGDAGSNLGEDTKNDAQRQMIPVPGLNGAVLVRLSSDTAPVLGIVTKHCEERGCVNVTVFPDGETPRPIGNVPHAGIAAGSPYWDLA